MKYIFKSTLTALAAMALMISCSSSSDSNDEEQEFVATVDDLKGYTSWTKVDSKTGPDPLLQTAHGANDPLIRNIFVKDNAKPSNGKYSVGTIIVKELRDDSNNLTGAITAMVKRGGEFNPDGNGWEWFMTDVDLTTVMTQGDNATAGGGMCANCHAGANVNNNGTDWVFTQP